MKVNEVIYARTHAEFLNDLLDKDYNGWMKCAYKLPDGKILWFIPFDGEVSKAGWRNTISPDGKIIEEKHCGEWVYAHRDSCYGDVRVVFDINKNSYKGRSYIFKGVFLCVECSNENSYHCWQRVAEEYFF